MASASAPCLSLHRSNSNANVISRNGHQQNFPRQLRRGNCRSMSLSHFAPLKAVHTHQVESAMTSSLSASSLSSLKDTPGSVGNSVADNVQLLPETSTPVPHYFAPICPVPLPPLYGLPIVEDDNSEEISETPCKRPCYGNSKFDSCNVIIHCCYTCSRSS